MRAIVVDEFGPPERLRVAEMPPPAPDVGEVLVRVHAAPVNYVDLLVVGGTYQWRASPREQWHNGRTGVIRSEKDVGGRGKPGHRASAI
jgi:NADPH:quinone reductase